jgi:hypothetical protein
LQIRKIHTELHLENLTCKDHFGELAVDERTTFVEIREHVTMWAAFIWLRIGSRSGPL